MSGTMPSVSLQIICAILVLPSRGTWTSSKCQQAGLWKYSASLLGGTLYAKWITEFSRDLHRAATEGKVPPCTGFTLTPNQMEPPLQSLPNWLPRVELTDPYWSIPQYFVYNCVVTLIPTTF
jgi:hypothetical protein